MSIQVLKQTVEAKTRKLSARWTFEAAQDANSMHGLDVEAEIMQALAQEITAEIDQEVIASLNSLAGVGPDIYNQAGVSGTATFVGDEHGVFQSDSNCYAGLVCARVVDLPFCCWRVICWNQLVQFGDHAFHGVDSLVCFVVFLLCFRCLSQRRVGGSYALRVSPAVTRLTVYRRPQVTRGT